LFLFGHNSWHDGGMIRFGFAFLALALLLEPSFAQVAKDSSAIEVAPQPPVDPNKKRAEDMDRLFGQLQDKGNANAGATIAKIWTLWSRNDSAMAEVLLMQSNKALQDGAFDTSEQMLNELIGAYPEFVEALNKRAMLYYNQKRYDEAMVDLDKVLDAEPRHFGALSGKAAVFQAQGNPARAADALRDAIAVNPYLETAKEVLKQLEHDYPTL
jgi:tetratricopeptide (TPR) repeat protein